MRKRFTGEVTYLSVAKTKIGSQSLRIAQNTAAQMTGKKEDMNKECRIAKWKK